MRGTWSLNPAERNTVIRRMLAVCVLGRNWASSLTKFGISWTTCGMKNDFRKGVGWLSHTEVPGSLLSQILILLQVQIQAPSSSQSHGPALPWILFLMAFVISEGGSMCLNISVLAITRKRILRARSQKESCPVWLVVYTALAVSGYTVICRNLRCMWGEGRNVESLSAEQLLSPYSISWLSSLSSPPSIWTLKPFSVVAFYSLDWWHWANFQNIWTRIAATHTELVWAWLHTGSRTSQMPPGSQHSLMKSDF